MTSSCDFHTAAGDIEKVEDVELQWQDASSVDYTHFYRDEPRPSKYDDQCVTLDTEHGMWITEECSLSRGFVCRVNKGTVKCGHRITCYKFHHCKCCGVGLYWVKSQTVFVLISGKRHITVIFHLTHCGLVTPFGVLELGHNGPRQWLIARRKRAITWTNVD